MRRREYLVGGAGLLAVFAGGAYVAFGGDGVSEDRVSPVTVQTLEAPGSSRGTMTVPQDGRVTVIELFEPYCGACHDQFPELASAHEAVGDRATFVSLVPESSEFETSTIVEVWRDLGGNWPVGIDPEDHFFYDTFHVTSVPHVAVVDREGYLALSRSDVVPAADIETAVLEAAEE